MDTVKRTISQNDYSQFGVCTSSRIHNPPTHTQRIHTHTHSDAIHWPTKSFYKFSCDNCAVVHNISNGYLFCHMIVTLWFSMTWREEKNTHSSCIKALIPLEMCNCQRILRLVFIDAVTTFWFCNYYAMQFDLSDFFFHVNWLIFEWKH